MLHVVVVCAVNCPSRVCLTLLQQQCPVDITVHWLLCNKNWVFGEKPVEQSWSDTIKLGFKLAGSVDLLKCVVKCAAQILANS